MSALTTLVRLLREREGSSLIVAAGRRPQARIKGQLHAVADALDATVLAAELEAIAGADTIARVLAGEPVDFPCEIDGERMRARCTPSVTGLVLVLRSTAALSAISNLGLPSTVGRLAHLRRGFVVIAGPTGSGKTTTVGAIMNELDAGRPKHVVTIESPIDLTYDENKTAFSQREVGTHTPSFAAGIEAALRMAPDVIFVSDLPDALSAERALEAAAAGALVFVTLKASGVVRALDKIVELSPERRRATLSALAEHLSAAVSLLRVQRADGTGHVVAAEIMLRSRGVVRALREDALPTIVDAMANADNMQTMDDALAQLVKARVIAVEDAYDHARDKRRFAGHRGARRVMRNTRFIE